MQGIALVKNLGKSYGDKVIFHKLDMTIGRNEPIVIMGDNGCGKSTFLKILAGVLLHTEGEIEYYPNIKISFIPDRFPKLPFSVEEYLMHMGRIQGVSASLINDYIDEYFGLLNMPLDFRKTKIGNCSKGTIQKVNILQALITKPDLLVMDEPFSGLDEDSEEGLLELIHKLALDGVAIVLACHEKKLAQRITDRIYIFSDKQCRIINGFAQQYRIIFIDKADGRNEVLVEKADLPEALGMLISKGHEIYSVNPRHIKTGGGQDE